MTVHLDDWSLSGLSGAMDWTVILPPAVSGGTASSSSTVEQSHFYPALYTELTPTVLTGSESASTTAAAEPLVYARVSSIVRVEKVGPRQLRLRQQLGSPGSHRLLFLTASSATACDEWWRVLHRLTYNNGTVDNSTVDATSNSGLGEGVVRSRNSSDGGKDDEPWRQRRDSGTQSEDAPKPRAEDVNDESTWRSSAPPSRDINDVSELKHLLLSPTPPSTLSAVRPSLHLSAQPPRTPPPPPPFSTPSSQITSQILRQPATSAPPSSSTAASLSASTIDTLTATSSLHALAATAEADAAAAKKQRHFHRRRHRQVNPAAATSASAGAAVLPPSRAPGPPLVVLRATRSEATQTRTAAPVTAVPGPAKPVVAPPLNSLVEDENREEEAAAARWTTATPRRGSEPPPSRSTSSTLAAQTKSAQLPYTRKESFSATLSNPSATEEQPTPPPRVAIDAVRSEAAPFFTADGNVFADAATAASESRRYLEPTELQMDVKGHSASPLPEQNNSLSVPAWKATSALRATTTARDSLLYEPIHIDTAAVPRARSTSPPALAACHLNTRPLSNSTVRPLSWYGHGVAPSYTPRLAYSSPLPYSRGENTGSLLHPYHDSGGSRWRHSSSPSSPARRDGRRPHRRRSPNALTAKPSSSSSRLLRSRSASPLRRPSAFDVSPLLSVIATPHLFLKYPVQTSSAGSNGTPASAVPHDDSTATYVFVTTDEDCVVTVPAGRFKECVADAKLLKEHAALHNHRSPGSFSMPSMPIGVRSYERAKHFFGEDHCRAIRMTDVDRVTRGNEEPLILLNRVQRERFRDASKLVCIISPTHAFLVEATNSTEAEWYVRSWKKYLRARRKPRSNLRDIGY
ncbi:hypothetical protein ABB37_00598 [Leptomonas pyrrhocoris]|uniref:Kinetoplastid PH-like domain-containing protein n=1 Tax=Leptomonas pyrrhocoris TaxID=157538 RepID=A0A0M9GAY4_LEPPY|nr:hypothetical protein ABB37_00598 [Leptomonas pyrrhocoris]XP_015664869.1 hypothetical protein ABB37_00598 [Leptomonas pyrrhocoris]KPA86429.1 hypothetical protein ABB37_00598 [Leptomonas pyrrhocoris]KPA86430.1 hypothetical protein ABB37_00598 [Leptomonas pyrrhocoris]|eukprot:XP_015664868.1 hypothetical protein ABB37_00598 [Leptomonas pyrrhocoris]